MKISIIFISSVMMVEVHIQEILDTLLYFCLRLLYFWTENKQTKILISKLKKKKDLRVKSIKASIVTFILKITCS